MPEATRPGAYYLADLRLEVTGEKSSRAVDKRKNQRTNTYYGNLPNPWAGVAFAFTWELDPGSVDVEEETSKPPLIKWEIHFEKQRALWGSHRANTQAGKALLKEISKTEAVVAALRADPPGGNPKAQVVAYLSDLHGRIDGSTFVFPPGDTLKEYLAGL